MKKLTLILCLILMPTSLWAGGVMMMGGGAEAAAGASCPADGSPDVSFAAGTDTLVFGSTTALLYGGTTYQPSVTKQVCKIAMQFIRGNGDITNKSYTCKIWTLSGSNLDAVIANGTSAEELSDGFWSATWVVFEFSGNPTMTSGVEYGISVEPTAGADATNYANFYYTFGGALYTGIGALRWDSSKVSTGGAANRDNNIRIYYYD